MTRKYSSTIVRSTTIQTPFREKYKFLAWANPSMSTGVLLRQALVRSDFDMLLDATAEYGFHVLQSEWNALLANPDPSVHRAKQTTSRMLRHIQAAL